MPTGYVNAGKMTKNKRVGHSISDIIHTPNQLMTSLHCCLTCWQNENMHFRWQLSVITLTSNYIMASQTTKQLHSLFKHLVQANITYTHQSLASLALCEGNPMMITWLCGAFILLWRWQVFPSFFSNKLSLRLYNITILPHQEFHILIKKYLGVFSVPWSKIDIAVFDMIGHFKV